MIFGNHPYKLFGAAQENILFVTGNINKKHEVEQLMDIRLDNKSLDLVEIQSIDVHDVIKRKIHDAYNIVKRPVIVEDTGLYIYDIMNNNKLSAIIKPYPGALIRSYFESLGPEQITNIHTNARARAQTIVAYHDGVRAYYFDGEVMGNISATVRGSNGFGWDNIFIPKGSTKTFAEMSAVEKNNVSMRRIAFKKLSDFLAHVVTNI